MTVVLFITLLTIFATVTSLITEGVKKLLDGSGIKYASNIVVCIVAAITGIGGTAAYYVFYNVEWTAANIVCMVLMGLATAIGSMTSYDKVVQAIEQIHKK